LKTTTPSWRQARPSSASAQPTQPRINQSRTRLEPVRVREAVRAGALVIVVPFGGLLTMDAGCHQPRIGNAAAIQSLWDYNDPAASESRLREALSAARAVGEHRYAIELMTQVARAQGLQRRFDDALATLAAAEAESVAADDPAPACVRMLLERGRILNSSGQSAAAGPLFVQAWELATNAGIDGLAVDAAHMIAIVDGPNALTWNEKSLALAKSSADPDARRWMGSLHNNIGWTYHGQGSYATAMEHFEAALIHRVEQGKLEEIRVAQWCIARCRRSLGQLDEALKIQRELERTLPAPEKPDGYVLEEIAECLHALGRPDEAQPYFRRAHEILSPDAWLAEAEPKRIARLERLA
jgi:tetratricopeptide (TPR) repeat protein